MARKDNS
ncbi:uncharacterized protein FFE2_16039 [Fusarium fujikuroi]|nr:uncharacterized protein FFE2_16039 [Fusarium fujikuroi]SCO26290.1 uncharacterized protein FFC1_15920 [Fusarium fujikuroi]